MTKCAFTNADGILTAWGNVDYNNGDACHIVPDDFNMLPGRARLVDGEWQDYTPIEKPASCTRKQGNMALYEMGYLDEVQAIVAAAPENVRIAYNDAATFERTDPFLQMMASDIGLTDEQLDQLFALAVTL